MEFTKEESEKLDQFKILFKVDSLSPEQIEAILGRKLAIQAAEQPWSTPEARSIRKARKQRKLERGQKVYSLKRLFQTHQNTVRSRLSSQELQKLDKAKRLLNVSRLTRRYAEWELSRKLTDDEWENYNKVKPVQWSEIAKQAAKKALRREAKKQDETYRVAKFFRDNEHSYRIEKIREYNNGRFKTTRSDWKIYGDIDIFQLNNVISELIYKMTTGLPENVKLQVSLENTQNDRVCQTKLIDKPEIIRKLADWVNLFVDYYDMKIEDTTFKLIATEIPTGAGKRVNKIITAESKRSIISIKNNDTICLARAIVTGLAKHNREKLQLIFKGNLTEEELRQINKSKQTKTKINQGILSNNEVSYLVDGRKLQEILAKALHRIFNIPIKQQGNDFQDVKLFEESLDIEIQIYNLESRQIYKGADKPVKVYILMSENHFDVISTVLTTKRKTQSAMRVKTRPNVILMELILCAKNATKTSIAKNVMITM